MRKRLGVLVHVLAVVALVPAYLLLAPASDWSNPLLLAVLAALAVIAIRHDVPLPSGIAFDATAALALIACALAGPLPALAVILPPIAINALTGRETLIRAGNLANLAAYGWYTLAGAVLLQEFAPGGASVAAFAFLLAVGVFQLVVELGRRPGRLRHAVARAPDARARGDAARRVRRRHDHGRARRGDRPALRLAPISPRSRSSPSSRCSRRAR